jgi:transposase
MDVLIERCAGLDVHRDTVVATVRRPGPGGARRSETRTFTTMTGQLEALAEWLAAQDVSLVGMESTGIYWRPVYYVLEDRFPVWVINAEHLRNVPGRKTDVADSMWIAQLIEHGLVSPSFVPPRNVRLLRDVTRHGRRLTEERTRAIQRLEKVLQDAGIKLTSVASTILGKTGRAILAALLAGEEDPAVLAELAKGRLRPKIPALREALTHRFRLEHHGVLIAQMLAHIDFLESSIAETYQRVEVLLRPVADMVELVMTIPGVGRRVAEVLIAEVGLDMTVFPDGRAPGVVGRDLPGQQLLGWETPPGTHPPRFHVAADRADRGRAGRRPRQGHLPGRAPRPDPRPAWYPESGRRDPPRHPHRLLPHRPRPRPLPGFGAGLE